MDTIKSITSKFATVLAVVLACALGFTGLVTTSQAAILDVMVSPRGTSQGGSGNPEPLYGTLTGLVGNQFDISNSPGMADDTAADDTATTGTTIYNITFSSHPTYGDITFDLSVTPNAGGGMLYNGSLSEFWSVDTTTGTGGADTEQLDEARIQSGETVTFSISNVSVSALGYGATFVGFTGIGQSQQGSFDTGTGIFTGVGLPNSDGTGGRINQLQFELDVYPIPEPSTVMLLGLGGWMLYGARKRFRRS